MEDLRELSESMYEGLATIRETHENEESRLPAFLVSLLSRNFRFATVKLQRDWPRKRDDKTWGRVCPSEKKLVSRCFDCKRFGHGSGDPICRRMTKTRCAATYYELHFERDGTLVTPRTLWVLRSPRRAGASK